MGATYNSEILIVGAGICGLMAATELVAAGYQVLVVDKEQTVGGRLATRGIGPGLADYGAQFLTARDRRFARHVAAWQDAGLIFQWSTGWSDGGMLRSLFDGHPRYATRGGMNALAKRLAADIETAGGAIHTGARLALVRVDERGWRASDDEGNRYIAKTLVLTPPVPQVLAMLDSGGVPLGRQERGVLQYIRYAPCLCGLFWIDGGVNLPEPGALQRREADVGWIADNQRKGISPEATVVTVHAGPAWSRAHYDDDDGRVLSLLGAALRPWLASNATIREAQIQRWRYALPTILHSEPFLCAQGLPPLYIGGDAFGGPRVEGAALSGLAIAAAIKAR